MIRRIVLALVPVVLLAGAGGAVAHASVAASPVPAAVHGTVTPDVIGTGHEYLPTSGYDGKSTWLFNQNNQEIWSLASQSTVISVSAVVVAPGWQEMINILTGDCIYIGWPSNTLYDKPCSASKTADLWASALVGSQWAIWSKYIKDSKVYVCPASTYAPVITAFPGSQLYLECPDINNTTYGNNQVWNLVQVG